MSGVARNQLRIKANGEVFTPTPLVNEVLDSLPKELFEDTSKTFLDNSCGDGQFLSEVLIRKLEHIESTNGSITEEDFGTALESIYGVDLMEDNVELCQERLLCGFEQFRHIVQNNIIKADGLKYNYSFGQNETFAHGLCEIIPS